MIKPAWDKAEVLFFSCTSRDVEAPEFEFPSWCGTRVLCQSRVEWPENIPRPPAFAEEPFLREIFETPVMADGEMDCLLVQDWDGESQPVPETFRLQWQVHPLEFRP